MNKIVPKDLTELEFIYYSAGSLYYKEQENKNYSDLFNYFAYEIMDLKYILLDLDACVRGLGGCKKTMDYKNLPSIKAKKEDIDPQKEETPEERLERHKKFFASLKKLAKNKKDDE